jgi:hypothetical protein
VIDEIARSVTLGGRVKGAAWRAFTPALAVRFTLLMTLMPLMPDAGYPEVAEALIGDLALVAWQRPYRVPTAAADCTWREGLDPVSLERLRDRVLAGTWAPGGPGDGAPAGIGSEGRGRAGRAAGLDIVPQGPRVGVPRD